MASLMLRVCLSVVSVGHKSVFYTETVEDRIVLTDVWLVDMWQGKGKMTTYWLAGKKSASTATATATIKSEDDWQWPVEL